jgi:3'-5' exoribonuclease
MKLADLRPGETIIGYYALSQCELVPFEGGVRLQLEFSDASGKMAGVMWGEEAEVTYNAIKGAEVVKIKGFVGSYRDQPQMKPERIRPAKPEEYDLADLLPTSKSSEEELEAGIAAAVKLIDDAVLNQLVTDIIDDPDIHQLYFRAPAGKKWHHPYLRGLAEHSLSMARAANLLCEHYAFLDRSLMIAGALLHDLGKIRELSVGSALDYSLDGRLLGHIVMGYEIVRNRAIKLEIAEDIAVRKLLHMILSHQGKKENSTPVLPAFEEAYVLYFLDEIDSKLNAISLIRQKPENEGNDFSPFIKLLETHLYLGQKSADNPTP